MTTSFIMSKQNINKITKPQPLEIKYFRHGSEFILENGESLPELTLAYNTFGRLNEEKDNVVWIIHALTGNSNPMEWWPGVVGEGLAIDPNKHFIVCANCLGSHYGSTNALSINPLTQQPYFHSFPLLTVRDVVNAYDLLRHYLGLSKIKFLAGASLGGQQALEWAVLRPDIFSDLLLIATNARHSPWGIAFNESQRLAIQADPTWTQNSDDAGQRGLLAARALALLSYRSPQGYNSTQYDDENKIDGFKASSYQKYQGEKLVNRFNTFSYWTLSKIMDSHNIGRGRGSIEATLSSLKARTTIIGIESDILFPLEEQKFLYRYIPNARLKVIVSNLGHDGFLTENEQVGDIIKYALE